MRMEMRRGARAGWLISSMAMSSMAMTLVTAVRADVTIEQKTTLDVASTVRMHGGSTTNISGDKKREDTESHCEGMLKIFCGNLRGGDIVRLDKDVNWDLEPDKKRYRETVFASPEELAAMRARIQAHLEKMKSCPVSKKQETVDKSKCEMSPPKFDVHKTDDKATIAGHEAQHTLATMTTTCTDKENGDVCDTVVAVDLWLTQDKVPGMSDRRAFDQAYAKKLGLDDPNGALGTQMAKFLAPYQSQIKQLTDKSADMKGLPLKTSFRIVMGGPHCSSLAKSSPGSGGSNENPLADVTEAGKAVTGFVGGLFKKKKTDADAAPADSSPTAGAAAGATPAVDPYAQYSKLAAFSMETSAISTDAVAPDRFEIPADWKKIEPKQSKVQDDDDECPKT